MTTLTRLERITRIRQSIAILTQLRNELICEENNEMVGVFIKNHKVDSKKKRAVAEEKTHENKE